MTNLNSNPPAPPARQHATPNDRAAQKLLDIFNQALRTYCSGDWSKAENLCRQLLKANPDYFDALNLLGAITAQTQRLEEAAALLGRAVVVNPNDSSVHCNRGNALQVLKQFDAAIASYDRAIAIKPDYAEAYSNRGNALQELMQFDAAVASYDRAVAIKPDFAGAYSNRGNALQELNRLDEAVASYDRALAIRPDFAEAYFYRGIALQRLKQFDAAISSYNQVISIWPEHAEAHNNRGYLLKEFKQFEAAIASYNRAIASKPDYAEAYGNRGIALRELQQFDAAVASYDRAIAIKPDYTEAYYNRGIAQQELGQPEAAIASYDLAIALDPDYTDAHSNRGNALLRIMRLEAAVASYERAISIKPDFADAFNNRGLALQALKQINEAIASYDCAISIKPDYAQAYLNKSMILLLTGDFAKGWDLYEWRWKVAKAISQCRHFSQPLWLGNEPLANKTILLHCEQGLGDTIQFCRYANLLAELGAKVIAEAPKALLGLLHGLQGVSECIEIGNALPQFDYQCPMLSLPLAFKTSVTTIPSSQAYLKSDDAKLSKWSSKVGYRTKPRIGIVWSGSTAHENDHNRSVALSALLPFLPNSFDYFCLQKELRETDEAILHSTSIRYFGSELEDFTDTAALCELMDVVISVDTSVVHLSGALGKKTWLLLPYAPDWRWLFDRSDSPWYPSVKLYRQERIGDWEGVFARVRADLLQMT